MDPDPNTSVLPQAWVANVERVSTFSQLALVVEEFHVHGIEAIR